MTAIFTLAFDHSNYNYRNVSQDKQTT